MTVVKLLQLYSMLCLVVQGQNNVISSIDKFIQSIVPQLPGSIFHNGGAYLNDNTGTVNTENTEVYDLCVIGAGMFGSAAARHASASSGLKVCLIGAHEPTPEERPLRDIFGAHYDAGRMVEILDVSPAWRVLAKHTIERCRDIEAVSGVKFYTPVGCLFWGKKNGIYMTNLTKAILEDVSAINVYDPLSLQKRFPFLSVREDESAFFENDGAGYINPRRMVYAQKKIAQMQGCKIVDNIVNGVSALKNGVHENTFGSGLFVMLELIRCRTTSLKYWDLIQVNGTIKKYSCNNVITAFKLVAIFEVKTESMGTFKAKKIIFATGAFFNLKNVGVPLPISLGRSKETAVLLEISDEEAKRLSSMPTILREWEINPTTTISAYILPAIQYPDGKYYLKFGKYNNPIYNDISNSEEMKQWYLSEGNKSILNTHLDPFLGLLPGVKIKSLSTVPCVLADSPHGRPYIDMLSPTITVALAGNGNGAKISDEVGRLAAQLSINGKWMSEVPHDLFKVEFQST